FVLSANFPDRYGLKADRSAPEILQRACVVAGIGERIAARVPEHVRMDGKGIPARSPIRWISVLKPQAQAGRSSRPFLPASQSLHGLRSGKRDDWNGRQPEPGKP